MTTIIKIMARLKFFLIILCFLIPADGLLAMTQILPDAKVEGDSQQIIELIGTFDRAQEAIRAKDIDTLMSLYASNYEYRGLTKADIRKIWAEVFSHYDLIANIHTFSAIRIVKAGNHPTAEITCTGSLWARSVDTKERVPIDSWHQEVHRLVRGDDGWHIIGNLGGKPGVHQFGAAPHPLF